MSAVITAALVLLPSPAPTLTLMDQTGREVSLPAPPRRIVSLVPSVKAERLFSVDGNLMHHYGPRVVDGLELLARLVHPEAFKK
jgi:ABC-type Fe3+-hydroxamate transport system substrate-binding protein